MSAIRIHYYIGREVAIPTLLGLVTFTFVLIMGRVLKLVEMILNKGVPFAEIAKLFVYLLPAFLVITIPLSFLLGVLLGFGRLSTDSEVVALKSTGFSLYDMVKPVTALALAACLATAFLTLYAVPAGNSAFRNQVFDMASNRASIGLQPRIFNDEFDGLVLYANDIEEQSGALEGVFISDERAGATPSIILAEGGQIISDRDNLSLTMRLKDGSIHRRPPGEQRQEYQIIRFATYDINLNMGQQLASADKRPRKPKELSLGELLRAREATEPPEEKRRLTAAIHKRFVLPLAPLIFGLIGVPLGIQSHRSGRGGGFALALGVFLCYYILLSFAETLAGEGIFPAAAAIWTPNILFLTAGLYLLRQTARERRISLLDLIIGGPLRLARRHRRRKVIK